MKRIDKLKELIDSGSWEEAIQFAAKFPTLGAHKGDIERAAAVLKNPAFYIQIKKDPQVLIDAGILAIKDRFLLGNFN